MHSGRRPDLFGGKHAGQTKPSFISIRIVGVDQQADELNEQANVAKTVTVEVTPEQGQKLALAQRAGTLSLSLRGLTNDDDAPIESIRLSDIIRDESPTEEGPKATVKVRRAATDVSEFEVKERDEEDAANAVN